MGISLNLFKKPTKKIIKTKIICITGYSGSGKTTMAKLMKKYLPNSCLIIKDAEMSHIYNVEEFERNHSVIGIPVNTNNATVYFREAATICTKAQESIAFASADTETKYLELLSRYLEDRFNMKMKSLLSDNQIEFIILEFICLPVFKIWNDADFRIIVRPSNWESLIKNVGKRGDSVTVTPDIAKARYLSTKHILENVSNVTHEFINHYDNKYKKEIKKFCNGLTNNRNK